VSEDKNDLFLHITAKCRKFGHLVERLVYSFIQRFLVKSNVQWSLVRRLVVSGRKFGVPSDTVDA
jgi:hypothetical protein